jgi:hypothetical protein
MGRHSLCSVCYLCTQHVRHACRRRTVLAPWEARNAVLKFNADVQGSANCMMGSCSWKHIWQWAVFLVWVGHRVCYTTTRDFLTDIRQFHWSSREAWACGFAQPPMAYSLSFVHHFACLSRSKPVWGSGHAR